ncbi:MAG: hypothetical protein JST58_01705 [Bacteroidetes bacterium]|nr:hypothetical protein [Bacteroidota bacterium]
MRDFLLFLLLDSSISLKAQMPLPASFADNTFSNNPFGQHQTLKTGVNKKWFLNTYSGIGSSYYFFKGGNAWAMTAPMGLQLSRKLDNNVYAFAAVSAVPAYINFNQSFLTTNVNKGFPNYGINGNHFGFSSRVEMGLMYINDARTFSISGSIGVERSSSSFLMYQPTNTITNGFLQPNR